jgi:Family of unknown function (DUF6600)/FecR protein
MLPRPGLTVALAVLLCLSGAAAQAQPPGASPDPVSQYDTPAYVAGVDGNVTLERDGRVETSALNMPLLSGDRLRTADGRVEVRFADGGRLFLDARTSVDFLSDELIRLIDGRVRIAEVRSQQVSYRVDSPAGSARLLQPGEYRVALLRNDTDTQLEFAVIRGAGEIFTDNGTTPVRAGQRAYASAALAPSYAYAFNSAGGDDFDRWTDMQRGTVYAGASQSAEYLPEDMTGYASTFDQYGDWRYQQEYGYVWYPRVASDWRPYYYGRWASYPRYGWTWIAADRFGYPTHHYGRWGFSAGLWFWIPSPHWGPAYVSWGYATDYVSWCPLGWNNRAVLSINVFGGSGYYAAGPRYYSAWTIVPRGYFGRGYAYQHAVGYDHFRDVRPRFIEGRAPAYDRAIPRNSTPIRYAGTRSAPFESGSVRGTTRSQPPRYVNRGDTIVRSQTARPIAPRDTVAPRATPNSAAQRESRAWDNPAYRPPNYSPAPRSGGYERTLPQSTPAQPRGFERPGDRAVPGFQTPAGRPFERSYERRAPQYQSAPRAEPSAPRGFDRGAERPMPREQASPRQAEPRQSERAAPAPRPSGGDRAAPRSSSGGEGRASSSGSGRQRGRGR